MHEIKVGLLPMYIELYDQTVSFMRPRIEAFYIKIAEELEDRGLKVLRSPVCRLKHEFEDAVKHFEEEGAVLIVTLHLAYSPSLESADVLSATRLPVLALDTTETYDFSPRQSRDEILYNHGIHGVQDLCNLLLRKGKTFQIYAGHWKESNLLDRAVSYAKAAKISSSMKNSRVGIIGKAFEGMGDFQVPEDKLKANIGIVTVRYEADKGKELLEGIDEKELAEEMEADRKQFVCKDLSNEVFSRASSAGLMVRKWVEKQSLTAFTVNFMSVDKKLGLPAMPFLEASKAMSRGIGYAGEGDVLTAALVGSLASVCPEVSFSEMFCPDWKNDCVFLSHMGEMNPALTSEVPILIEKEFDSTDVGNTVAALGCFKPGKAFIVNLAPGPGDSFSLIAASGEMQGVRGEDKMAGSIHGWFKPSKTLAEFLEEYSHSGGTHHIALVYGEVKNEIIAFGKMMDWKVVEIV